MCGVRVLVEVGWVVECPFPGKFGSEVVCLDEIRNPAHGRLIKVWADIITGTGLPFS